MKKSRFMMPMIALALVISLLAGCGAAKSEAGGMVNDFVYDGVYDSAGQLAPESGVQTDQKYESSASTGTAGTAGLQNQKLIRTMYIDAETDDMDTLLAKLDARITELGGYWENKTIRNGSYTQTRRYRSAQMTIRIPVSQLDAFVSHIEGATNIISYRENADDITLSYVATASRITALETEQQRLLELLAKAEDMTDLLLIEQRLTDVRTELEEVTSQLRLYDNLVDYGTVELSVTQVQEYTVVEEETVWQRMGSGLKESWQSLCEFTEDLLVLVVSSLPFLIPVGLAVILLVVVFRLLVKKPGKKHGKPQEPTTDA